MLWPDKRSGQSAGGWRRATCRGAAQGKGPAGPHGAVVLPPLTMEGLHGAGCVPGSGRFLNNPVTLRGRCPQGGGSSSLPRAQRAVILGCQIYDVPQQVCILAEVLGTPDIGGGSRGTGPQS